MAVIPGFDIVETLLTDGQKTVYRATRSEDGRAVVLKVVSGDLQATTELIKLRREYELTRSLDIEGVSQVLGFVEFNNGAGIVMADWGGEALLRSLDNTRLDIGQFLGIARALAGILAALHRREIIHKDIKPDNILRNPATGELRLIDFGIAAPISQETVDVVSHRELEGSLPYLSPEQTGRMNRPVDYRTDFYSLGITFYQLLIGRLPFESGDPVELMHAHLARRAQPIGEIRPDVPLVIQSIVSRLLEKSPEERYQSAAGLKKDIKQCIAQWEQHGRIDVFDLAANDRSERFSISQKLYGRARETDFLLRTFDAVCRGQSALMLVSGYSGIGKSALINELHKPVVGRRGYFTSGKFDQFNRNAPYSAVIAAFRHLLRQLLSESDEKLAQWKARLLDALGANGRIIIDVIPEVELITGEQPEVPVLPPSEAQNRFNRVFLRFVQVFPAAEHPLVLFLDDLQWADMPSLKLIELLLSDIESTHLLLIGAYRDNEVDARHPLTQIIETLRAEEDLVHEITLKPLPEDELRQLVADTLHTTPEQCTGLSDLLTQKTGGNPFFVNEFLKSLHTDKLVVFDHSENRWSWNIDQIRERNITNNVVELMIGKIRLLDESTQQLCQYAACIGNKFDLVTLATVWEKSSRETAKTLWPAIREGLLLPIGNTYRLAEVGSDTDEVLNCEYRFLHDQVQNAAYSLLENDAKKSLHLRIARLLLGSFSEREKSERIFELTTQFNHGAGLISDEAEKMQVIDLNLSAGKRAKNAAAYEPAFRYLQAGLDLLPPDAWKRHYETALELHNEAAEAAYLSARPEETERLASVVFAHANSLLDQVKAYGVKIQGYLSQTRNQEALDTCIEVLRLLGVELPGNPGKLHIVQSLIATKLRLRGKSADQLVSLPDMSDPKQSAIMEILPAMASASYFAKPNLFPLVVFKQVSLSVRYGNHVQSSFAYATYGLVMCGSTLEFDEGLKFGEIATRLLEKFKTDAVYAKIHYIRSNFITHWRYHFRESLGEMTDSYYKGLETGDFLFASYAAFNICTIDYYMGKPLPQLQKEMDDFAAALIKIKQNLGLGWLNIYRQTVANLLDEKEMNSRLEGPFFDEKTQVAVHEKGKDFSGLCVFYMNRMILAYLFGKNREALENGEQCYKLIDNVLAGPHVSSILFFYTLTLLRIAGDDPSKRGVLLRRAEANIAKLKKFAKSNPDVFSSKLHLAEAEWHRIKGKNTAAATSYRNAIQAAHNNEFTHEKAIANELAAFFWKTSGDSDKSRQHLVEARKSYQKWGATAKVTQLDRIFDLKPANAAVRGVTTTRSGSHSSDELDMLSLSKAALAIAGEIQLDKLMSKLMHVVVENAGAQRGYLVIERDGRWRIEAAGQADESENTDVVLPTPLQGCTAVAESVIQYVIRTREDLVLGDVRRDSRFANDPVVLRKQLQSVLCLPVFNQGKIIGILYAENNLNAGVFTDQRVQFMKLLSGQVAVSLENALQYERLEQKVASRTAEVVQQKEVLEKSLHELKMAQAKLVESEKMASLGQLTAGIAHEINNPINFVAVGVKNLVRNFEEAQQVMDAYLNPEAEPDAIAQQLSEKERRQQMLEIFEDSAGLFKSIQNGVERTISIVKSLRNFSRLDEGEIKIVDLHEGLDSTLEILQGQIRKKADVIKKYGDLPPVECAAGKINQVFLNIINNALQAIEGHGTITLETRFWPERRETEIAISDTGSGMNEATRRRLFEPFFTTKPVGEGTGLGLSISYNIIEEHKGRIEVESKEGQGSTFRIFLPVKDEA